MSPEKRKQLLTKSLYIIVPAVFAVLLLNYLIMPLYVSLFVSEVRVPKVTGMTSDQASTLLEDYDLEPVIADTANDENKALGEIISQRPAADKVVKSGRRVYLVVNAGPPTVFVPNLYKKSYADAVFELKGIGLELRVASYRESDEKKGNLVLEQNPASGTKITKGGFISVVLSKDKQEEEDSLLIEMPNLVGLTLNAAKQTLRDYSLSFGSLIFRKSNTATPNTVIEQNPLPGKKVKKWSPVRLTITKDDDSGVKDENPGDNNQ